MTGRLIAEEVPPPGAGFTAVKDRVPVADTSADVSATLTWVALTNVVGRALPFTSITVDATKPVPVIVITGEEAPTASVVGLIAEIVGAGFGAMIVNVAGAEVPPPGFAFTAVRERLPAVDMSAALSVTLT